MCSCRFCVFMEGGKLTIFLHQSVNIMNQNPRDSFLKAEESLSTLKTAELLKHNSCNKNL